MPLSMPVPGASTHRCVRTTNPKTHTRQNSPELSFAAELRLFGGEAINPKLLFFFESSLVVFVRHAIISDALTH
jgi:hypothetical protein